MSKSVIADSSPLIVLLKSNLENILPDLFDEILIPESVSKEILAGDANDLAVQNLPKLSWLTKVSDTQPNPLTANYNLGNGEIAVINLAMENTSSKVILDDFAARKCAKDLKVSFIGTGGLLISSKTCKVDSFCL